MSINDLTKEDILDVFSLADSMVNSPREFFGAAAGLVLATLFYEPSTRTRLSFEAAMQRLGGGVVSSWDMKAMSVAKGEALADTVRVVSAYADLIVLRHSWEGASQLAAEYADVPVINAGDGGHEHPTQTLCDLYTLRKHHGKLDGLMVALCGDLQNGRAVHSLVFALARFGAGVVFLPGEGKDIPQYVLHRLEREFGVKVRRMGLGVLGALFGKDLPEDGQAAVNAIYMTPTKPHQPALLPQEGTTVQFNIAEGEAFSIYVTRRQVEREQDGSKDAGRYPVITPQALKPSPFKNISILHPLPRVDELSPEVDKDDRSLYFKQAAYGLPIRMALLHKVLGLDNRNERRTPIRYSRRSSEPLYCRSEFTCSNNLCVTNKERPFVQKKFEIIRNQGYALRCLYCDHESQPLLAGNSESRVCYPVDFLDKFKPYMKLAHVRFFASEGEAEGAGFKRMSPPERGARASPDAKTSSARSWIETIKRA